MAAQQEKFDPETARGELSASAPRLKPALRPPEERLADGNRAYMDARARQRVRGLDHETVRLYEQASHDLMAAEIDQRRRTGTANPHIMLRRAASMAWQAEATPYGVFYPSPHGHVDVRSNLHELALRELHEANDILLKRKTGRPAVVDTVSISPGLVAEFAAEAAEEAGMAEYVLPELITTGGVEDIDRYIGEQAMSGEHGAVFTALVADKEDTGIHDLPLEA